MRPGKYLLPLAFFLVAGYFFSTVREVMMPFVLSAVAAYLANPLVHPLELRGYRRDRIVLVVYVLAFGIVALGGWGLFSLMAAQLDDLKANYPRYLAEIQKGAAALETHAARLPYGREFVHRLTANWQTSVEAVAQRVPDLAAGLATVFEYLFLVPFITFFLMAEGPQLLQGALDFCPSRYIEMVLGIVCEIEESLGNYVRGILLEAVAVGGLTFVGLAALGVNYSVYLGLLVAVANLVPYAGPVVGALSAGVVAAIQFKSGNAVLSVVLLFVAVKFIDDWVFQPVILKRAVEMHPVLILFSLMAGASLDGFVGVVFAVPVACVAKVCVEIGWDWYRTEFSIRPPAQPIEIYRVPVV
jgi:predicted PurR-regulated permease PerM